MNFAPGVALQGRTGSYRLKGLLGKGGMGQVWLAESPSGALVAVKVSESNPVAKEKLLFECQILKILSHDHVVSYVDEGEHRGYPFLVAEYIPGKNLEQLAREAGRLSEEEARSIAVETLLALDYIHSLNIVHRDVKPKNLLAKNDDIYSLKLIDFGTSTLYNRAGMKEVVFSPGGFTAPEQYRYLSSPQSDIWSVGATLFFLLTGRYPQDAMPGYPNSPPPRPISVREFNRDVSEELETVIRKAMSWNPSDRFLSAREMIEAIESSVQREEVAEDVPILEVMGKRIRIDADRLIFGRMVEEGGGEKVRVRREGDVIYVQVADVYRWIGRRHFEIFRKGSKWYIRDLGSLNRTAVQTRGVLVEVWVGRWVESPPVELGDRAVIYVAYGSSLSNPPYLVVTFRGPKSA